MKLHRLARLSLLTASLALLSAPALAQGSSRTDVTEHEFTDADTVTGDRATSWMEVVGGRRVLPRRSLIRPRTSFSAELLKSAEAL